MSRPFATESPRLRDRFQQAFERWRPGKAKAQEEPRGQTWAEYIVAAPNRAERRKRMAQARAHAPGLREYRRLGQPHRRAFRGIHSLAVRAALAEIGLARKTREDSDA